ncbi:MAG: methyltransferase domain-containing protein [Chromatiales bacterium]|nr:methyltransferase domain-containing protein [Chromatiales bacterium]
MRLSERLLFALSRPPDDADYTRPGTSPTLDDALDLLKRVYPDFDSLVANRRVADFGCGDGFQSLALATRHGCTVVGIESNPATLRRARENAERSGVGTDQVEFVGQTTPEMENGFDIVISQNSFEHFPDPIDVLGQMKRLASDDGQLLVTFGPPWYAPYGSHMHFFCRVPWINVLFSERTVMNVRKQFRDDGAMRYTEVESGLNMMSLAKFESIVSASGLQLRKRNYECVKGINVLASIPVVRELMTNHVTAILTKPAVASA